jgi:hypothetical protein
MVCGGNSATGACARLMWPGSQLESATQASSGAITVEPLIEADVARVAIRSQRACSQRLQTAAD